MRGPGGTGPVAWNGPYAQRCLRLRLMPTVRAGKRKLPGTAWLGKDTAWVGDPRSASIELVPDLANAGQRLVFSQRGLYESLVSCPVPRDLS
jgi:hypothetical protein